MSQNEQNDESNEIRTNRRGFLAGSAGFATGLAIGSMGLGTLVQAEENEEQVNTQPSSVEEDIKTFGDDVEWPFPLPDEEIPVEEVRKRGHLGYYTGACSYGAFAAVIDTLQEMVGEPYNQIPNELLRYGEGGAVGWGATCGALIGGSAALNLVLDEEDYPKAVNELFQWYCEFNFPSDKANAYAENGEMLVDEYKTQKVLPQNASNSPLCHVSVTRWSMHAGYASGSAERSERCGRLTGDVAAKVAEILNAKINGNIEEALTAQTPFSVKPNDGCRSCHAKGQSFNKGGWSRGKMECGGCHKGPHQEPSDIHLFEDYWSGEREREGIISEDWYQ